MAEIPRRVLKLCCSGDTSHFGVFDGDKRQHDEGYGKHRHGNVKHHINIGKIRLLGQLADKRTHKHRRERAGQRIERAANHVELVASFATATQQVEHGINHGVEQAHRHTRNECTQQINKVVTVTFQGLKARNELHHDTHQAQADAHERRFLVADAG